MIVWQRDHPPCMVGAVRGSRAQADPIGPGAGNLNAWRWRGNDLAEFRVRLRFSDATADDVPAIAALRNAVYACDLDGATRLSD